MTKHSSVFLEANLVSVFSEASSAGVKSVFPNDSLFGTAHSAWESVCAHLSGMRVLEFSGFAHEVFLESEVEVSLS